MTDEHDGNGHRTNGEGTGGVAGPSQIGGMMASPVTRRRFLLGAGAGTISLASALALGEWAFFTSTTTVEATPIALSHGVVKWDRDICSGCRTCETICSTLNTGGRAGGPEVARILIDKDYLKGDYTPTPCAQCADPPCLKACPIGALQIDEQHGTYARVVVERACIGCQKCVEACSAYFGPEPPRVRFDPENRTATKCHLCFGDPQCVKFCPLGALRYDTSDSGLRTGKLEVWK